MTVSTPGNGCPGDNLRGEGGLYLTGKSGNRRRGPRDHDPGGVWILGAGVLTRTLPCSSIRGPLVISIGAESQPVRTGASGWFVLATQERKSPERTFR